MPTAAQRSVIGAGSRGPVARREQRAPTRNWHYRRPWLYPKQEAAIFDPRRYSIIEASTKSGKTHGCGIWLTEQAICGKPGENFWWVAPVRDQAKIAFRRLFRTIPPDLYDYNLTDLTIHLKPTDTTMWFKGSDRADSLYGEDVRAAVIDESSRCQEDAWHAVRSTLTATRGPVRIIGNVRGKKNWAYRLALTAKEGTNPNLAYHRITAFDAVEAGVLDAAEIEDARRALPEDIFRELYLAEATEDGGNPFGLAAIEACLAPMSMGEPVVWGWDLAKSGDFTVGIALDADGYVCRIVRFQKSWRDTKREILRYTGYTQAVIDSTGVGDPVLEELQADDDGGSHLEGVKLSLQSKQQYMEGLQSAIQQQQVHYPDGVIRAELDAFEYQYTKGGVCYAAPKGNHDDCVIALALANSKREPSWLWA